MKTLTLVVLAATLVSCAHRTKVLNTSAISMTHESIQPGMMLQNKGPVNAEFCMDTFGDKGDIGLMDEAVKKAQTTAKVDYILNATFWSTGTCMQVEGEGAVIAANATTTTKKATKK